MTMKSKPSQAQSEFAKSRKRARKRMRLYQTVFITLAILLIGMWALRADTADSAFQEANNSYNHGDYAQAIDQYQNILEQQQSANLQYNLGNAYYKLNDFGLAILHYEKARMLEPNNPEFEANLKLAQKSAQLPESHTSWLAQFAMLQHINTWVWLGCIAFWLTIGCFILPKLYNWRSPIRILLIVVFSITTLASITALWGYHHISKEGIVLHKDTPLKLAPTSTSPNKAFLNPGSMATVVATHAPYYLVETASGKTGWVKQEDFQKTWD